MKGSLLDSTLLQQYVKVYLNEKQQKYVQAFDTKEGWIEAFVVDENGVVESKQDEYNPNFIEPVIKRIYGKVEVKLEEANDRT